jgi:hypothetical protein
MGSISAWKQEPTDAVFHITTYRSGFCNTTFIASLTGWEYILTALNHTT